MQTFIVKLGCLFLFSFIFFSAYQTNVKANSLSKVETLEKSTTLLVSNTASSLEKAITEQVIAHSLRFN